MKKLISAMAVAAVCFSAATSATTLPDAAGVIDISGTVTDRNMNQCQIKLDTQLVNLTSSANDLIEQGQNGTDIQQLVFSVSSTAQLSQCDKDIWDGKVAVKFVGIYDSADGTGFANTAVGENAATGVGIGLFNDDRTPFDASKPYNVPGETNTASKILGLQLIKLKGQTVKTGTVSGNITFQIERL